MVVPTYQDQHRANYAVCSPDVSGYPGVEYVYG
jgi:hypothetical protein